MNATATKLHWKLKKWSAPHLRKGETIDAYVAQLESGYFYLVARHESLPNVWMLQIEGQRFDGTQRQLRTVAECHARANHFTA